MVQYEFLEKDLKLNNATIKLLTKLTNLLTNQIKYQ